MAKSIGGTQIDFSDFSILCFQDMDNGRLTFIKATPRSKSHGKPTTINYSMKANCYTHGLHRKKSPEAFTPGPLSILT